MKNNFLAGFILIGTGLLFGLPHLLIPIMLGGNKYFPLGGGAGPQSAIVTEEVYTYVPEVQEILEGRFPVRDTQLSEYKRTPSPFAGETLPAVIMAGLAKLTGSIENAFRSADFLFPPIAVWLIYRLSREIGVGRQLSLLTGAAAIITTKLIELVPYPRPVWDYLINLKGSDDFLFFSRNFHPQLSFLLFVGMMLAVIAALKTGGWKKVILAGVLIGAQFYTYFFSWTATAVMLAILTVWQIWQKNWRLVKRVAWFSLMGFIVSLPYVWEILQFRSLPIYQNFFLKNSLPARSFILVSGRYLVLVFTVYWLTRKKRTLAMTTLMTMVMAAILLPEAANLFLGRDPEGKHWIRRLLMPLSFPLAAMVCDEAYRRQTWFKLKRRAISASVLIGLMTIFLFGVRVQISASEKYARWFHLSGEKQQLFDWLISRGRTDESVGTLNSGLIAEIPAFSGFNNAVPITTRSIATTDESLERFLWVAQIYQLTPSQVEYLLWSPPIAGGDSEEIRILADRVPELKSSWVSRIFYFTADDRGEIFFLSQQQREKIGEEYRGRLTREGAKNYRVDLAIVGPAERRLVGKDSLEGRFLKVFSNDEYSVYRINQ